MQKEASEEPTEEEKPEGPVKFVDMTENHDRAFSQEEQIIKAQDALLNVMAGPLMRGHMHSHPLENAQPQKRQKTKKEKQARAKAKRGRQSRKKNRKKK